MPRRRAAGMVPRRKQPHDRGARNHCVTEGPQWGGARNGEPVTWPWPPLPPPGKLRLLARGVKLLCLPV